MVEFITNDRKIIKWPSYNYKKDAPKIACIDTKGQSVKLHMGEKLMKKNLHN